MYIIYLAILFAMVFYSISSISRMVKAVKNSGFLGPIGGSYGIGWFTTLIILNIVLLIGSITYYIIKRKPIGESGPQGYEGNIGQIG